ncbi:MAG: M1 family metallopeptidase [Acidimicrobiales bacterium]|jgi:puromycin-sensitive aminopeptidase
MSTPSNPYRLARTVIPSAYRIAITPDLEGATFSGEVHIEVEVHEAVTSITLNALELTMGPLRVSSGDEVILSREPVLDETYETATFELDKPLAAGPATLEVTFDGTLNDLLVGFYRSTYVDPSGQSHTIATTQFEHTDARRAFPCFDEPALKATHQIDLTVANELAAYSNSPEVASVDLGDGTRRVSFAPTMKMSTYLVAFVIGDFEETAPVDVNGTPLRVIYPVGKGRLAALALEMGAFALDFFATYFDIAYPGDKMDMIAIPDFAFGAMENLGLVTYRETALLVDPEQASLAEKKRVAEVVAHELAHMWFGDLVTMEWWEGVWLNEAFATFCAALCEHAFRPEWKIWTDFGIDRDVALQVDGLHTTRPIEYPVVSPDDARGMFDVLTYEKGGSVLRMLELFLGPDVYREGIRRYLRRHSYANTVTSDLWDALEEASGQPVRAMMNTFILQGGHPLVTLDEGAISQRPFAYGPARAESNIGSSWLVPVFTRSLEGGAPRAHLLGDTPITIDDRGPVVVNAGGSGVFRSHYGDAELAALRGRLDELEELERTTLLADSWAALFAGVMKWDSFLALARGLGDHDEPTTWTPVATALGFVSRVIDDDQRPSFTASVRELFVPQYERLGWVARPGENALAASLRAIVLGALGTHGADVEIRAQAVQLFEAGTLEGDLARTILRIVADQNRPGDYETFLERRAHASNPQEEQRYLWGLADFADEEIALDAAEKCFGTFRNQDSAIMLGLLSMNRVSGPAVWRYVTRRWDEALDRFPPATHARLAAGVPTFITDGAFADEVEAFHTEHSLGGEQRMIEQQLERMRVGLAFASAVRLQR